MLVIQNGEPLPASSQASYQLLQALVNTVEQTRRQQQISAAIFSKVQADSALLKAISILATVCLPVTIVAVSHTLRVFRMSYL